MNKYGLIGFPLSHSFSKIYFDEKFKRENINSRFDLFPLKDIQQISSLIRSEPLLKGLAVTIPHKQTIIPFLSELSDEAKSVGAVNCIKMVNGLLIGFNTDVTGFEKSILNILQPYHTRALVLGTGGSSKAVQYVLKKLSIDIQLVSSSGNGNLLYSDFDEAMLKRNLLIINCTPLGMFPDVQSCPDIPYKFLTERHLLFDLVYNPEETLFLKNGKKYGAIIKNGIEMLHIQAEENWRIWNS